MKATITVDIIPFPIPDLVRFYVSETIDGELTESFKRLDEMDASTLDKLCEEFRYGVFKKAGKNVPPTNY